MFEKFKQHSLKKHIDKSLTTRDMSMVNAPLRTIGFLIHETAIKNTAQFYDCYKVIQVQPKDIKLFSFLNSRKKLPSLRQNQVYNKDFTWNGNLLNANAKEFLDIKFDVLVGFYDTKNYYLDTLVASSNAKFKVGLQETDKRLFDLTIDVSTQDFDTFIEELKKYLLILNKI